MVKLLLIADDFTGALDSSIFFAGRGAPTAVQFRPQFSWDDVSEDTEVLAVNSASRHLPPEEAAACVRELVLEARRRGIGMIFKKVDSALRGNVGSELEAVLESAEGKELFLLPAYPGGGRATVGGVQLWNGVPISDTAYRHDPREPVVESNVKAILRRQTSVPISEVSERERIGENGGILVLDAADNRHILQRCREILQRSSPILIGGCAGIADALADCLYPHGEERTVHHSGLPLLVVSGSMHPVSAEQMAYGRQSGLPYHTLRGKVELQEDFVCSDEGRGRIAEIRRELTEKRTVLLETACDTPLCGKRDDAVSRQIAALVEAVYDPNAPFALAVFGGDTLLEIASRLFTGGLFPQYEVEPGVPLALVKDKSGHTLPLISKSGGFGTKTVIDEIRKRY